MGTQKHDMPTRLGIRITQKMFDELEAIAHKKSDDSTDAVPFSQIVRDAIDEYIFKHIKKRGLR